MQNVMSPLTLVYGEGTWPLEAGMDWPRRSLALGQECQGLAGYSMLWQKREQRGDKELLLVPSLAQDHLPAHPTRKQNEEWS